mmetsp:Transcript_105249/g.297465  ORF Transcript_105249/g.297465 Transcript_105249/m.297465 type:complete len:433 (+) Transcript_105249:75-1373(+)
MEAIVERISKLEEHEHALHEGDTAWVLTSAALVLLMTPGLAFFYGGLVRNTTIINTMMMSIVSMGINGVVWAVLGFSLAFGEGGPFIGSLKFAGLANLDGSTWGTTTIWGLAFAMFQMTFAIISAAIVSGSLVERAHFGAYVLFTGLWTLFVYVPLCHWVWAADGWICRLGAVDFAGGTVVHISSGTSGLVAAAMLGPRVDRSEERPHNVPFVLLGAALLWFGWSGFNGGSALAADAIASRAIAATYLAACSSMLVWAALEGLNSKRPSSVGAMVGAVAGLVVITPAAGFVSPMGAIVMGALGAPVCYYAVVMLNAWGAVDDTLDAFGIHGVGGFFGAVLTGFFAVDGGLLYSGNFMMPLKQLTAALAGMLYSAGMTALIFALLKLVMRVRAEAKSIDKLAHGEAAYGGRAGFYDSSDEDTTVTKSGRQDLI